jgi:colanic acid/amylovoran biosynthesis glycosyltransferase
LPEIGVVSETFIRWDVHQLLPGGTAVIVDPPPAGDSVRRQPAWDAGACPVLAFDPLPGDPDPSPERLDAAADFLAAHDVEAVLAEYLDFADRWFDFLIDQDVRVWLRGHGVDFSARLTESRWRDAYQRYADADGILVPSEAAARALIDLGLPARRVHVVRYSVELPALQPEPATGSAVRCVMVGRLVAKKAPLLTLDAFRRAAQHNHHLELEVVGDGPLMESVRDYLGKHDLTCRVRLRGRLPHQETLAVIRGADLLLHHAITSPDDGDTEGQPLAILEAMAAGVPVVSTYHAGIPEVVTNGGNGRLVPEHDVAGMAGAILDLAADPTTRAQLGAAARTTIEQRHGHQLARQTLLGLLGLPDISADLPTAVR